MWKKTLRKSDKSLKDRTAKLLMRSFSPVVMVSLQSWCQYVQHLLAIHGHPWVIPCPCVHPQAHYVRWGCQDVDRKRKCVASNWNFKYLGETLPAQLLGTGLFGFAFQEPKNQTRWWSHGHTVKPRYSHFFHERKFEAARRLCDFLEIQSLLDGASQCSVPKGKRNAVICFWANHMWSAKCEMTLVTPKMVRFFQGGKLKIWHQKRPNSSVWPSTFLMSLGSALERLDTRSPMSEAI